MGLGRNKGSRIARRALAAELLESRVLLRASSLMWGEDNLTLSFAPDGTDVAGRDSALFATFGAVAPEQEWRAAILRGFQTWAMETNLSIGVVDDSGDAFGSPGLTLGDNRFGDIRIGAAPLADGIFAIAVPASDILSGTWVGDVIFNSSAAFSSVEDIFAVALHEAGHVFGLDHSADASSPMHVHGISTSTTLTAEDAANIQSLFGSPQADSNEWNKTNDSPMSPTQLQLNGVAAEDDGSAPSIAYGTLTDTADIDYFRLPVPAGWNGPVTITLRSSGISLLAPRLTIVDSQGNTLGDSSSTSEGDIVTVALDQPPNDGQVLARVASVRSDQFAIGAYSLFVEFEGRNEVRADIVDRASNGALHSLSQEELAKFVRSEQRAEHAALNDDRRQDDDFSASVRLSSTPGFPQQTRYAAVGSIADPSDADFYRVLSPAGDGNVLTLRLHALDADGLNAEVKVFDQIGDALPLHVLVNGRGEQVIQVVGVAAHANLTLRISSAEAAATPTGNYALTIGFADDEVDLHPIATGTIAPGAIAQEASLYVALPQLFHLALLVPETTPVMNAIVVVTIRDAQGAVIHRVAARPGDTRSAGSVLLAPGEYRVQTMVIGPAELTTSIDYTVLARATSMPFGADPTDPTLEPEFRCDDPEHAGMYCYPGEFVSPDPYLWSDFVDTIPDPPADLTLPELIEALIGPWWTWVWGELGINGPPLTRADAYRQSAAGETSDVAAVTAPRNVLDNDIDPEGESVTAVLQTSTTHGQLFLAPEGTFSYEPEAGFQGMDLFVYVAYDGVSTWRPVTVRITVGFRGDYDLNNVVDGYDFLVWQRSLGAIPAAPGDGADGDGDGYVGAGDLWAWSDNFADRSEVPQLDATILARDLTFAEADSSEPVTLDLNEIDWLALAVNVSAPSIGSESWAPTPPTEEHAFASPLRASYRPQVRSPLPWRSAATTAETIEAATGDGERLSFPLTSPGEDRLVDEAFL